MSEREMDEPKKARIITVGYGNRQIITSDVNKKLGSKELSRIKLQN